MFISSFEFNQCYCNLGFISVTAIQVSQEPSLERGLGIQKMGIKEMPEKTWYLQNSWKTKQNEVI